MYMQITIRRQLSILLAVCVFLSFWGPYLTARGQELPGEAPVEESVGEAPAQEESVPETTAAAEPESEFFAPYGLYFGLLHGHTDISDGVGSVEEAFQHAASVEGLDFFAVTDHSDSFDNGELGALGTEGSTVSTEWARGKAAAAAVTGADFLGIYGYEMSWEADSQLGHITTFQTPGWVTQNQEPYKNPFTALVNYCKALGSVPGAVSQFCHPGRQYGDFIQFSQYDPAYGEAIHLLEVGSGQEGVFFDQYPAALDAGWHVAPSISQNNHNGLWGDADDVRTVVLAEELTQKSIFEAIRARRVYATQDRDLRIWYMVNGQDMGGTLVNEEDPEVYVSIYDPTGEAVGKVQVLTTGGTVVAAQTVAGSFGELQIPVPEGLPYCYLKVIQPDGDVAVTAPVWMETVPQVGISDFWADDDAPDQGQKVTITLSLVNEGPGDAVLDSLEVFQGETKLWAAAPREKLTKGGIQRYQIPFSCAQAGTQELLARARMGSTLLEKTLSLTVQPVQTVTGLVVDGSHGADLGVLDPLMDLAREVGMEVTVFTDSLPRGGKLLVVSSPKAPLEPEFLEDVADHVAAGGHLLVLGGREMEPLLEALGSALTVTDVPVAQGSTDSFHSQLPWCQGLVEGQYFTFGDGYGVSGGQWLVRSGEKVLMACEAASGGTIFLSACDILSGDALKATQDQWEYPRANRIILQSLLGFQEYILTPTPIGDVRTAAQGEVYRVKGYVTAGTSNPSTTFPDTVYLQDDTGGIAVAGCQEAGIQIGAPLEVIGVLARDGRNLVLEYQEHRLLQERYHRYVPKTRGCSNATDYAALGGQLVQVQGKAVEVTLTQDKAGITRLEIRDLRGDTAIVEIEDAIRSGSSGKNTLAKEIKKGRSVRAMGLLHINAAGEPVIRVRNCDEVVYIPPEQDMSNPPSGDRWWDWLLKWLSWF